MNKKIYIVGAGPGDPGLITLKGLEYIKRADVILYDRLIPKDILSYRKPGCILRHVGKRKGIKALSQDDINAALLKYARTKKTVVRLKGGDPFIFGRGAEEALFLAGRGIEYEVIPGVSSFYAVPEICDIPLTHRGIASGFLVVTGHEDPKKGVNVVDWKKVAQFNGTVLILMGKSNLKEIVNKLIANGLDGAKPCAVIYKGSTKKEKLVCAAISDIYDKAKNLSAPSLIVIGDVVNMRDRLNPTAKPHHAKRYLVTASDRLNRDIKKEFKRLGANIDCVPMVKISPNAEYSTLDTIITNIERYDRLLFTSRHGVIFFLDRFFHLGGNINDLERRIGCVGSGTAAEFIKKGVAPLFVPKKFTTRNFALELRERGIAGKNVALLRTKLERDTLKDILSRAGAKITDCIVYNVEGMRNRKRLHKAISKKPDGILFLSPKSVNYFFDTVSSVAKNRLKRTSAFFSIGPVTTETLKRRGIDRIFSPSEHTVNGLVNLCMKDVQ
jgi:uroporphyrinogen III methyltransferase/synthase